MILECLFIIVGIAIVLWGADRFTDGACGLARRLKVSELVVGLTVVALGTSLPEFIVSFFSVMRGSDDMSVGNILGSNIFNTLVIIGASAFVMNISVEQSLLRRDIPICLLFSLLLFGMSMTDGILARWESMLLLMLFFGYLGLTYYISVCDRRSAPASVEGLVQMSYAKIVLLIVVGVLGLVFGGRLLVDNAAAIARDFHISESIIGLTILAAGTSLPELATSMVAAKKGSDGLALGNAIGSNVFNIAFVLGTCGIIKPMQVTGISHVDWGMLIGSCILLWIVAWTGRKLSRWEGIVLLLAYLSYLMYIIL